MASFARTLRSLFSFPSLSVGLLILVAVFCILTSIRLHQTFATLEQSLLQQQVQRFMIHLLHVSEKEFLLIQEYAEWDETHAFMTGENPGYLKSYFDPGKNTTGEDVAMLFDSDRHLTATRWLSREDRRDSPFPSGGLGVLLQSQFLQDRPSIGFLEERGRILLLAAGPILHTDRSGPSQGWMVFGHWMDAGWLNKTFDLIGMDVQGVRILSALPPGTVPASVTLGDVRPHFDFSSSDAIHHAARVYLPLLDGEKIAVIDIDIPMHVLSDAMQVRSQTFFWGSIAGLSLCLLLFLVWQNHRHAIKARLDADQVALRQEHQAAEHLRRMTAVLPGIMYECEIAPSGESRLTFINDAVQSIFGLDPERLLNDSNYFFQYVHPDDREFLYRESRRHVQTLEPWQARYRYIFPGIGLRWVQSQGHLTRRPSDQVTIWNGFITDITDLRRYEEELIAAKSEAEQANSAKSEFLATMSHEIRTPLHGVIGFTSLLKRTALTPEQKEIADSIEQSSTLLLTLVTGVLDLSRIEAGRMHLAPHPCSLLEELRKIERSAELEARRRNIAFYFKISNTVPPFVVADLLRLNQVLGNLLNNAFKFTFEGSVTLRVNAKPVDESSVQLILSIADTGIGIPASQRERLFNPFVQADSSLTRRFGGSGLGLAIVKKLCELMGGDVSFESIEGSGSTFIARVVLQLASESDVMTSRNELSRETVERLSTLKILVAEDNVLNQKLLKRLLADFASRITVVGNGSEAVDSVKDHIFDLVFMDVSMPVLDGLQATALIREFEQSVGRKRSVIIALTAGVSEGDRRKCFAAGMDLFLGKPFNTEYLNRILDQASAMVASES